MIECKNLSKKYGKNVILKHTNVTIKKNRISFLMGPNGHGKTTFIKCMMDMENYEGKFFFNGKSIDHVRDQILVLWDDCPFYSNISGFKNLLLLSENKKSKKQIKEIANKYLSGEILKEKVKHYSYGQRKILALVLVEILQPKYLIMDEISNGLDYERIRYTQQLIKEWVKHSTILLTGHQFDFYNEIIDDLFILKNQRITLEVEDFQNSDVKLEDIYDLEII